MICPKCAAPMVLAIYDANGLCVGGACRPCHVIVWRNMLAPVQVAPPDPTVRPFIVPRRVLAQLVEAAHQAVDRLGLDGYCPVVVVAVRPGATDNQCVIRFPDAIRPEQVAELLLPAVSELRQGRAPQ